jgi:hypothetical protein
VQRKKRIPKSMTEKKQLHSPALKPEAGELWIDPELNRTVAGPGGNRSGHTTPSAKLLHLADIALKNDE